MMMVLCGRGQENLYAGFCLCRPFLCRPWLLIVEKILDMFLRMDFYSIKGSGNNIEAVCDMKKSDSSRNRKVLVAMSGGVDSSVAALLLKNAGYDVTGVTMALGIHRGGEIPGRFTDDAIDDAARVCDQLGMPHITVSFASLMENKVIARFTSEYLSGRTPNPCVDCNRYLKFGALLKEARKLGFHRLATGHYARIENQPSGWRLLRPADRGKDQSYFLYPLRLEDLPFILFPLGLMTKEEVRLTARQSGLHTARRHDSQDICFVPHGDYSRVFSDRNLKTEPGDIVDRNGKILGRHRGIIYYTIGQRGGLRISAKAPFYVVAIDALKNQIIVGGRDDVRASGLIAGDLNLLIEPFPGQVEAKIRYRKKPALCSVIRQGDKLNVMFKDPQDAVTPGQAVVFYAEDTVLGGGVIEEAIRD